MSTAALTALEQSHLSLRRALVAGDPEAILQAAQQVGEDTARIGDDDWAMESRDAMAERITRLRSAFAASRGLLNMLGNDLACRQSVMAALHGDGNSTSMRC